MCSIMKGLHKYVPKRSYQVTYHLPEDGDFVVTENCFHRTLFGGDQLTVCRSCSAQSARCNDDISEERFDGLIPVIEDWHARMTLMRVRVVLMNAACIMYNHTLYRLFGSTYFQNSHRLKEVPFIS